jgi:hypothetical protein
MTTLKYYFTATSQEVGEWLDTHMPNPPLPEIQRWNIIGHGSIQFEDENDAMLFRLAWGDGNPPQRRYEHDSK